MRAAKFQASLRIRAVSPEPLLLAHTSSESRVTFKQKARSLAPLNGWACAVKICHDGVLEDTNSLDAAHIIMTLLLQILSKDSVTVCVDAVIYIRIFDATKSIIGVEDAQASTKLLAATTLRNILGTKALSEILSDREHIAAYMTVPFHGHLV